MTPRETALPNLAQFYPRVLTFLLLGLCAYVLTWFLQVGYRVPVLGIVRFEFIIAGFLTFVTLAFRPRWPEKTENLQSPGLFRYVLAFFLCILIQLPFSQDPITSWTVFRDRVVKFAFMAFFIVQIVRSPRGMRFFLCGFLLACAYITQESFRGALTGSMVWQNQGIPRLHGDTPLFRHPNSLGGLAVGILPFVYFLHPVVKSKIARLALKGLAVTSLGCLMYSGSRTAYVGLLAFGGFLWLSSRRKVLFTLLALATVAAAWPGIPDYYRTRFRTIFTGEEVEGSSTMKRKEIFRDSVAVFKANPLGVGVSAFPAVRQKMFGRIQDTHNLYMEAATNLGMQGLAVFSLLIFKLMSLFRHARKSFEGQITRAEERIKRSGKLESSIPLRAHLQDLRFLRAVCRAGAGYILIRLVLGLFGHDLYEIYWWIGIGMAASLFKIEQFSSKATSRLTEITAEPISVETEESPPLPAMAGLVDTAGQKWRSG